jgi:hypothetical protein
MRFTMNLRKIFGISLIYRVIHGFPLLRRSLSLFCIHSCVMIFWFCFKVNTVLWTFINEYICYFVFLFWSHMFFWQDWSFFMIKTYNLFVLLVSQKNCDYLSFNVAKLKCSLCAPISCKYLKLRISLSGFNKNEMVD